MMNMMTGAVAINGGVGVMEIHQPQVAVSQMAASAAQAAEQVALNAHITLRELKTKIENGEYLLDADFVKALKKYSDQKQSKAN